MFVARNVLLPLHRGLCIEAIASCLLEQDNATSASRSAKRRVAASIGVTVALISHIPIFNRHAVGLIPYPNTFHCNFSAFC